MIVQKVTPTGSSQAVVQVQFSMLEIGLFKAIVGNCGGNATGGHMVRSFLDKLIAIEIPNNWIVNGSIDIP